MNRVTARTDGEVTRSRPIGSVTSLDPRLTARRRVIEHDRKVEARQQRTWIIGGILFAIVLLLLVFSPLFQVSRIEIIGAQRLSQAELIRMSGVQKGENIVRVRVGEIERGLEVLPWVEDANVSRHLPGRLRLEITERQPLVAVLLAGRFLLIDEHCRVLTTLTAEEASEFPILEVDSAASTGSASTGSEEVSPKKRDVSTSPPRPGDYWKDAQGKVLIEALALLPPALRQKTARVMFAKENFSLVLRKGVRVFFGPLLDIKEKGNAALGLLLYLEKEKIPATELNVLSPVAPTYREMPGGIGASGHKAS